MEFQEGQVFTGSYPPEAADWCCDGQEFTIVEIEPEDGVRRFQIDRIEEPQYVEDELSELLAKLESTDYIAAKIAEGAATREEYAEQIKQRQAWRDRINELKAAEDC